MNDDTGTIKIGDWELRLPNECVKVISDLVGRAEKAEARVKELEAAHKKLLDGITEDCAKMRSILGSE